LVNNIEKEQWEEGIEGESENERKYKNIKLCMERY
jgi:hypothetical protein